MTALPQIGGRSLSAPGRGGVAARNFVDSAPPGPRRSTPKEASSPEILLGPPTFPANTDWESYPHPSPTRDANWAATPRKKGGRGPQGPKTKGPAEMERNPPLAQKTASVSVSCAARDF